jgi:hypothetical protein
MIKNKIIDYLLIDRREIIMNHLNLEPAVGTNLKGFKDNICLS